MFPNTTYYYNKRIAFYYYDADKNYVGRRTYIDPTTITTGPNVHYVMFMFDGTTMPSGLCINLHWSGYRDGEYEPYWKSERTIPATDLRSAGTVYDEQTATERIVRVGVVDLGTLSWTYTSGEHSHMVASLTDAMVPASGYVKADIVCLAYETDTVANVNNHTTDKTIAIQSAQQSLWVYDTAYTDAATFKAAMSGVMLHYALATPTTTPIEPPLNLSYKVSDFGTERVMHTAPSAAPTMQVVYGLNVVDTVRRLPTEYISHDSFTQFRIALGAKLGVFIIETWDETDNRYEYTINDA